MSYRRLHKVISCLAAAALLMAGLATAASAVTDEIIYLSSTVGGSVDGVAYADEDIVRYDAGTDTWELFFDGSDVLPTSADVDAFHLNADGSFDISLLAAATVTGLGTVDDSDIITFTPTSTGENTAGTFSMTVDGSTVGLTTGNEDVDAVGRDNLGLPMVSTLGSFTVPGASGNISGPNEDVISLNGTTWSFFLDGTDVSLAAEDLFGISYGTVSGDLYMSSENNYNVPGLAAGDGNDILAFTGTFGSASSGTYALFFDGNTEGFTTQIDALHVEEGGGTPNNPPTAVDDAATFGEDDGSAAVDVLTNDSDPDVGDTLTVIGVDDTGTTGAVSLVGGVVSYDPNGQFESLNDGETDTDTFGYTVSDGNGGTDTATVTITINGVTDPPNDPPTAVDDSATFGEDDGSAAVDVLSNDSDPNVGDTLSVSAVDDTGTTGLVTLVGGVVSYDPNGQFESLNDGETDTDTFGYTVSDGNGGTDTATVTITINGVTDVPPTSGDKIYLSSTTSGGVDGVIFTDEDVVVYDMGTDTWELFLDMSDLVPASTDLDAFHLNDDGSIDLSFENNVTITGIGVVDDSDILNLVPTSTGDVTSGTLTRKLDASTVGFTTSNEDIIAYTMDGTGRQVVSTLGGYGVPETGGGTLNGADEDLIAFDDPTWSLLFDGSDVSLAVEDLMGASIDPDTGDIYAASRNGFSVPGLTGDADDVFQFVGTGGPNTSGTFTLFFDGDTEGYDEAIDALHVEFASAPPSGNPPVAVDDADSVSEDGPAINVDVLTNDTDPDLDTLEVDSIDDTGTVGQVTLVGGVVTYDPNGQFESLNAGETDTDTFQYTVTDGNSNFDTATVTITINGADEAVPPTAAPDGPASNSVPGDPFHVAVDTTASGGAGTLTANDDLGFPTATITSFGGGGAGGTVTDNAAGATVPIGGAGSLTIGADGSFSFTPDTGFTGQFVVEYRLTNSAGTSDSSLSIFVGDRPVASGNDIYLSATNDGLTGGVEFEDEDIVMYNTASDTWVMHFDGSDVLPTSADIDGFDINDDGTIDMTFDQNVSIAGLGTVDDSDIVTFTPASLGDVTAGSFSLTLDASTVGLSTGVEDVTAITENGAGDLVVSTLGSFNVPGLGGPDEDLISLNGTTWSRLFDGSDVNFSAEDIVGADFRTTFGDLFLASRNNYNVPGLIIGDGDDILNFVGTLGPVTSGTYSLFFDGDLHGYDEQIDGLDVLIRNMVPTPSDDAQTFGEDDGSATVDVLANDTDPDPGDALTVTATDDTGTLGTVSLVGGVVSYDPAGQFESLAIGESTTDTFGYTVTDLPGDSASATVTITIDGANDAPTAADDADSVSADGPAVNVDVLPNDTDPDTSDTLTVTAIDDTGTTGTVSLVGGVVSYDPDGQFEGLAGGQTDTDTFTYTVSDGNGGTDTATVTMTINGADGAPTAVDDTATVGEDDSATVIPVTANDTDPDIGDTLTATAIDDTGTTGTVTLVGGVVSYDPAGQFESLAVGETDTDTFDYTVTDSTGGTDIGTVTVTIDGANDGPTAVADTATVGEDDAATAVPAAANDTDPDTSDVLTVVSVDDTGTTGTVTLVAGLVSYDPAGQFESLAAGETDSDTFSYTVGDGNGGFSSTTVTVTINGANDGPTAVDDADTVGEDDGAAPVDVLPNDSDPDGSDSLSVSAVDDTGTTGTVTLVGGVVSYDPAGQFESLAVGESTTDTFGYTVSDGNGGTDTATVTMTIDGANDGPTAADDADTVGADAGATAIAVLPNDSDPDTSDTLTVTAVDDTGTTGTVTLVGGVVSYDPAGQFESLAAGETDTDTFTYTVSDGNGGTDTATVTITITGANESPVAVDDADTVGEDDGSAPVDVLTNDSDPDVSDTLTVTAVDDTGTTGTVTLVGGVVSYDPAGQFESLAVGETDTDTFTYTVSDGNGGTDTATVTMTIDGANDGPTAVDDADGVSADDGSAPVDVLSNDSDPDTSDTLTVTAVDDTGTTGTVSLVGGVVSYDPAGQFESLGAGVTANDTFTYTVSDGNGGTDTATVTITVTGTNQAPTAVDDADTVGEDDGSAPVDVLTNDSDPDTGDTLTVTAVDDTGTTGTVTLVGGVVSYDPAGQFESLNGGETDTDSFSYTVSDGNGGTDTATVTITINGADDDPVAVDDADTVGEDDGSAPVDVLTNDSDPDTGDTLTVTAVDDTGTTGTVTLVGGVVSYDPAGQFESLAAGETDTDTFTYTVTDGTGGTDTATVTMTITGANDGPTAAADADTVGEDDGAATVDVLTNDSDPDTSDTLTVTAVDDTGTTGTVTLVGGVVSYDPAGQFEGLLAGQTAVDTFTYTVSDGNGGTDTATVTITVDGADDDPVAVDDADTVGEDDGSAPVDVLSNDSDADTGDTLTVTAVDDTGTTGTVTLVGGVVSYDPAGQFESLPVGGSDTDTFTYTVTDSTGGTDTATVTITVNGANDAPTAADDADSVSESGPAITVDVLPNDSDPDTGDVLTVTAIDDTGTVGTVSLVGGVITYDPDGQFDSLGAGATDTDTFTYTVSDGNGGTDTATVTITINGQGDPPVAVDDSDAADEDGPSITVDVLANDTDPDIGDVLTVTAVDDTGTTGTVTLVGGVVGYDPAGQFESLAVGETTTDTFGYTVEDLGGLTDTATVTITVTGENDAPTAADDGPTVGEDDGSAPVDVLSNDTDPDTSDTLSVTAVDDTGTTGTVTLVGGVVSYDPAGQFESLAAGESTTDTFTYTVSDGNGGTDTATVTVTVNGANDGPTAAADADTVGEDDGSAPVDVLSNDSDPDTSDTLTVTAVDDTGTAGTVTLVGGVVSYDPAGAFESLDDGETDTDTFTYTVSDGNGGTDTATVTITIDGADDDPDAVDDADTVGEDDGSAPVDVLTNDSDPDTSDTLTVTAVDDTGTTGTVTLVGGVVSYDPAGQFESLAAGETDTDNFTYTISDGDGATDTATVTVTIDGANDGPTANDDADSVSENGPAITVDVLPNDSDPDTSDTLSVTAVDDTGTTGTVTLVGGVVSYDPAGQFESLATGETDTDTFTYTVSDGNGGSDTATVTITINGADDDPVAEDDADTVGEDDGSATVDVLANDSDPDDDPVSVISVDDTGTSGIVSLVGGVVSYDPNGQFESLAVGETATDTFTYTISDGNGGTDTATVTMTVDGANDGPTANDDTATIGEDGPGEVLDLTVNDTDPDTSDVLTVISVDTTGPPAR